jgi:RNA polymerase-binding transcription factor DksA
MATKKPAAKVAAKKPAAKVAAKKPAAKVAAKKPSPKKVAQIAKKAAPTKKAVVTKKTIPAKKVANKPVAKAATKKSVAKAAVTKKIAKPVVKASVKQIKKVAPKSVVKKVTSSKAQTKPLTKKIETKKVVAKVAPAKVIAPKADHQKALAKAVAAKKVEDKAKVVKATPAKPEVKKPLVMPKINTKTSRKYEPDFTKSVLDKAPVDPGASIVMYSDSDLMEFKELIQRKLGSAKKELSYLQGLITRKDDMGGDEGDGRYMTMEDGSLSMEREQLSQMASRQITFVDHLEKALMRIENKTYGVCRITGKLIDKARLRAVPHATLSIEAKMGGGK